MTPSFSGVRVTLPALNRGALPQLIVSTFAKAVVVDLALKRAASVRSSDRLNLPRLGLDLSSEVIFYLRYHLACPHGVGVAILSARPFSNLRFEPHFWVRVQLVKASEVKYHLSASTDGRSRSCVLVSCCLRLMRPLLSDYPCALTCTHQFYTGSNRSSVCIGLRQF